MITLCLTILMLQSCSGEENNNSNNSSPKFEPPDGTCLFILGQSDNDYMQEYLRFVRGTPAPAGFAYYTNLSFGSNEQNIPRYKNFISQYPNSSLQLAVWTGARFENSEGWYPGYLLDDIVSGEYDAGIRALAQECLEFDMPIFIRFGYEFDGYHNAYPPDKYVNAYRYFVDKMEDFGVKNVAWVWHSWGVPPSYDSENYPDYYPPLPDGQEVSYDLWYPGDEYVDWVAVSIFGTGWGDVNNYGPIRELINFSDEHEKPLMIAESAAIKTSSQRNADWVIPNTNWFNNVFDLIESNNAVKAFTYINVDWEERSSTSTWGDTRINRINSQLRGVWLERSEPLIHASDSLYELIGYRN